MIDVVVVVVDVAKWRDVNVSTGLEWAIIESPTGLEITPPQEWKYHENSPQDWNFLAVANQFLLTSVAPPQD